MYQKQDMVKNWPCMGGHWETKWQISRSCKHLRCFSSYRFIGRLQRKAAVKHAIWHLRYGLPEGLLETEAAARRFYGVMKPNHQNTHTACVQTYFFDRKVHFCYFTINCIFRHFGSAPGETQTANLPFGHKPRTHNVSNYDFSDSNRMYWCSKESFSYLIGLD